MYFCGKEKRDSGNWWKTCGMRDSSEKGAGMRDQDPPFQTLINVSWGWNRRIKGSLLEAGLYLLLRSLMLVDPFERRLALEKLMLGNMTMERSADRQRRQTCGKGQERELHPDDLLKQKKTGPLLEDWPKGLALGQELWLWWGLEHTRQ